MSDEAKIVLKVGVVGDAGTGKTALIRRFVEQRYDEDSRYDAQYEPSFREKTIHVRSVADRRGGGPGPPAGLSHGALLRPVTFLIGDLGSSSTDYEAVLPLVCTDAIALLLLFDLTRIATLFSLKEWYKHLQSVGWRAAHLCVVGTKFDAFAAYPLEEQKEVIAHARRVAEKLKAPLVFCSASHSINIQAIFKLVFCQVYGLQYALPTYDSPGEPLLVLCGPSERRSTSKSLSRNSSNSVDTNAQTIS